MASVKISDIIHDILLQQKNVTFNEFSLTFFKLFRKVVCVHVLSYFKSRTFRVQVVKFVFRLYLH